MLFELKNIENIFDDNLVIDAEELLDRGSIAMPRIIEKNLWLLKVHHFAEAYYEIEIQVSGKKVKAFSCDCEFFMENKKCKHLVGGLLKLRKYLSHKELVKKTKPSKKVSVPKKFTTAAVLNNVDGDDLKTFIRAYARGDKKFALALKAKFANVVKLENPKEKYVQLLNATLISTRNSSDKINFNGCQQIRKIVDDVLDHVQDAMALEHYGEAFSILEAIFEKLIPIIKKAAPNERRIVDILQNTLDTLAELLEKNLPQDLKKEIWKFCLEEFDRRNYRTYKLQQKLNNNIFTLTTDKAKAKIILQKINSILEELVDREKMVPLLILKMNLLEKFQPKSIDNFIEENLVEREILLLAVEKTYQREDYKRAKQIALKGLENQKLVTVKNQLEEYLLKIAQQTKSKKEILFYSKKRFLTSYDFKYYLIFKENLAKNEMNQLDDLVNDLKKQPYHPNIKNVFAKIFSYEKLPHRLFLYIKEIRSLELLEMYDEELIAFSKHDTYSLYEDLLNGYLNNHLGRQTSEKIKSILFHLKKIGANKLVYKLVDQFRSEYKERHSLMEELAYF